MFLKNLNIEIYGESHSDRIGAKVNGIKSGYKIDISKIKDLLIKRNPYTFYNTKRKDSSEIYFESGINTVSDKYIKTNGHMIEFYLKNDNINSKSYEKYIFRPGHADYVSFKKFSDDYPYAGGGPFSGRMTALIIIIGEIARQILVQEQFNFKVHYQIKRILDYKTTSILDVNTKELDRLNTTIHNNYIKEDEDFLCFYKEDHENIINILKTIKENNDSVGSEYEFKISGIKENFGNIYFESFESILSQALFSIPGLKGINFGVAEDYYLKKGSELLEKIDVQDNQIIPLTNISGGINGGITNGYQDIYFTCITKPPVSINKEMDLLKLNGENFEVIKKTIEGRHDTFIGNKSAYAVVAWINIILLDFYISK